MKISRRLFAFTVLSAQVAAAVAADNPASDQPPVDTSQWQCKFCAFEKGLSGTLDIGVGYVSDDSFKFGEYTGLHEQGGFLVGNAGARFRGEDAAYWNVDASDLGLDSRSLSAEGGKQGTYKLFLDYKELPHFISDSAVTPFAGTGGNSLTLPPTWVPAPTTAGMTGLAGSLHEVDLDTKRKRLGVGVLIPTSDWQYGVTYRHETKEGTQRIAGAFLLNSAQLVMPVDYETDQVEASASYAGKTLQARFAYYLSNFRNSNDSLTWQNPYTPAVAGATAGQLALPPDNEFHQILASAGYQFNDRTSATADIALGRMTQDESFLPATLNSTLAVPPLPRTSLDGRVDTTNASLKIVSAVTDRLRLNAAYTYNDRDNKTPQAAYTWVTTDNSVNPLTRTNVPYSFTQKTLKLSADYRAAERMKASVGFDNDKHERTFQEVDNARENTIWAKLVTRNRDKVDLTFKVAHAERDNSGYAVVPGIDPPENPLLRKYNMADRTRDSAGLRADVSAGEMINVGFEFNYANDDYSDSTVGLTSSQDVNFGGDASVVLTKQTSLHFFLNHEDIQSEQAGSQAFSTPDWTAENNDIVDTAGIGLKHTVIANKLDVGADYTASRSHGEVKVNAVAPSATFPDFVTRLDSVKLYATYRLRDTMSLHGAYWYERYKTEDWMLENVSPNTIPNVLTFGEQPPSYHVNVITLSLRYKF